MIATVKALARSLATVGLLLLAGCGGESPRTGEPETEPAATDPIQTETRSDTIDVVLEEYVIGMPGGLPAGRTVLRIANRGLEEHNLHFRLDAADSVVWRIEGNVSPDDTRIVTVELEPGAYTAACDFAGHDARGMIRSVQVRSGG